MEYLILPEPMSKSGRCGNYEPGDCGAPAFSPNYCPTKAVGCCMVVKPGIVPTHIPPAEEE